MKKRKNKNRLERLTRSEHELSRRAFIEATGAAVVVATALPTLGAQSPAAPAPPAIVPDATVPRTTIRVTVNGRPYEKTVEVRKTLADFLRDDLDLTGTHLGCEHGVCGACTVVVDGAAVRSCLLFAAQMHGHAIETVEGLADGETLNPLQEAFREHHGLQCGFCTPGFLMTLTCFLRECPNPSEAEVREAISGNLCRCTGYQNIVAAALAAARTPPQRS